MKKRIRLTESELKKVVNESVRKILSEAWYDHTWDEVYDIVEELTGDDVERWKELCKSLMYWVGVPDIFDWANQLDFISSEEASDWVKQDNL